MYKFLSLVTGFVLAIMMAVNGNLTLAHGVFPAAAIIHLVGTTLAGLILLTVSRPRVPLFSHRPVWQYCGGAIGVITTVFQTYAYGRISMTSIVALLLLGQMLTSLVLDHKGWLGLPHRSFPLSAWAGLILASVGIYIMLDRSVTASLTAVLAALLSGVSVVTSRTINGHLSEHLGAMSGSFINHLVGLPITIVLALIALGGNPLGFFHPIGPVHPWIYVGGMFGVLVIWLSNVTVPRVSAFLLTLLAFVGQIFLGIVLDIATGVGYSRSSFIGGLVIATGVVLNLLLDRFLPARAEA